MKLLICVIFLNFFLITISFSEVILQYDFDTADVNLSKPTYVAPNSSAKIIQYPVKISPLPTEVTKDALKNQYISFTVAPENGYILNLTSLTLSATKQASGPINEYVVTDALENPLHKEAVISDIDAEQETEQQNITIDLFDTSLGRITKPTEVRIYASDLSSSSKAKTLVAINKVVLHGDFDQLGIRAQWMRGAWGALWLPEKTFGGRIEGVSIQPFLDQINHLETIDYIQIGLNCPSICSPAHMAPHPILESFWHDRTLMRNLTAPRASEGDPFLSWLNAIEAQGLRAQVYVNAANLLPIRPNSTPPPISDIPERWKTYCDTDDEVQAFIESHPHIKKGDPINRKYMFCYAEFILKDYAIRYGNLIDSWIFDAAHRMMGLNGDNPNSGLIDDQRIYQAFANAVHAGNPDAAICFNSGAGRGKGRFSTPTLFDDYTFGHPYGGKGNMVATKHLFDKNFSICEYMSEQNGQPFATTDTILWNDKVVSHFFPKQSTTSWNSGSKPCLTDEQFVTWNSIGLIDGGAITWGSPLSIVSLMNNSRNLTIRPFALSQMELLDAHLIKNQGK
ncbi:MAG: hypothetical protein ACSHX0_02490 [Akkermansiaceae bacterium]